MKTYLLKITSPDGDVFSGEVVRFCVRGVEGDVAIMAGHIPFITAVKPCECKIILSDGEEKFAFVGGGMLNVFKEKTVFLSGSFKWKEGENKQ